MPPAELQALLDELYRLAEAHGRDPKSLVISYKAPVYDLGEPLLGPGGERRPFSGGATKIADDIASYARLGGERDRLRLQEREPHREPSNAMESFGPVIRQTASL
jgi:hypothetical protein